MATGPLKYLNVLDLIAYSHSSCVINIVYELVDMALITFWIVTNTSMNTKPHKG